MNELEREASRWLLKAGEDLLAARLLLGADPPLGEPAAYHCQQAAEKLLKGVLIRHGAEPERTHDLARLAARVASAEPGLAEAAAAVAPLTSWSVITRYPDQDDVDPVTPEEVEVALRAVEALRGAIGSP